MLEVDPYDLSAVEKALKYAVQTDKPSVVITNRPCVLIDKQAKTAPPTVDLEKCSACGLCFLIGCPALESIVVDDKRKPMINEDLCAGCAVCVQICRKDAIQK